VTFVECFVTVLRLRVLVWTQGSVTNEGLEAIAHSCPLLEELNISQCKKVSDVGLKHISQLPKLTKLWLDGTAVTDSGNKNCRFVQ
jgi:hypothetical protein